ncbi:zinc ribbon domain-containing protein [Lyngbya confervoides]|uniref:zinc ribbon domain-containing protein n=1 Tax=Lyngbya confervoides TaxID=207921 RepID=UPI0040555AE9
MSPGSRASTPRCFSRLSESWSYPRGTSQDCPDWGAAVKKDLSVRISHCLACGSIKPRDRAAAQVIFVGNGE